MNHEHAWSLRARVERAEIDEHDPIKHTGFMLLICGCGTVTAFPSENFALTTERYRTDLRARLAAEGLTLNPEAK